MVLRVLINGAEDYLLKFVRGVHHAALLRRLRMALRRLIASHDPPLSG
jgi:hypothetical protein